MKLIKNTYKLLKKAAQYLAVPNNCVNTHTHTQYTYLARAYYIALEINLQESLISIKSESIGARDKISHLFSRFFCWVLEQETQELEHPLSI